MAIETRASGGSRVTDPTDKSSLSSGSASSSASGLRRSTRETSARKGGTPSPTFTRKSGRLEKLSPTTTPIKTNPTSPLRRSQRSNKQSSSSSSGSKNSATNLGLRSGSKRLRKEKSMVQLTLETKEVSKGDVKFSQKRQRLNARAYKAMHKTFCEKQEEIIVEDNFSFTNESPQISKTIAEQLNDVVERVNEHLQAAGTRSEIVCGLASVNNSRKRNEVVSDAGNAAGSRKDVSSSPSAIVTLQDQSAEKCELDTLPQGVTLQRVNGEGQQQVHKQSNEDRTTLVEDKEQESIAPVTQGASEPCIKNLQDRLPTLESEIDGGENVCHACKLGGKLLCCDGRGCERSYHLSCLDPPLVNVPLGIWHCSACTSKKLESGVHAVSEGVEAIWDSREVKAPDHNGLISKKQFFVKYKGLAHVHNQWVPETQLLLEVPSLVADFNQKNQVNWRKEWVTPHRVLGKRTVVLPKQPLVQQKGGDSHILNCHFEWLVKWCGLDYEHVSWELESAPCMRTVEAQSLMRDYETRHEKTKSAHSLSENNKKLATAEGSLAKLSCLPVGLPSGLDFSHVDVVNNLRDCWHKGANAVIVDDQERIMKVISFISSLTSTVSQPFLIITTSTALESWDEEFARFARCIYTVVYKGNKDVRRSIRSLEFGEGRCVMFQLLITSLETVIEDLKDFRSIKWEAIIVDEFQCSKIQVHSEQLKVLMTDMRLLLVNCELKDSMLAVNLLSLLESQSTSAISRSALTNSSPKIENLKERLSKYIANSCKSGCKFDNSRFVEYWVPVEISCMQLEQYCATLLSNVLFLRASSKTGNVGALRNVLVSTRKCCDHPNLMEDFPPPPPPLVDALDFGIKASGKLQILDTMLGEIRNQGLKVLVLFQSIGDSAKVRIGDILDDMVRQRFGENSYERVDGNVQSSKKHTALQKFNSEKQRFVFLLEARACLPSIKLTSVDVVIIFGSDWSPMNDIKSLQKITIDSQREQIMTFRLYSCSTMEEKILMLARHEKTRDTKLQNINRSSCHMLLKWGAAYMFRKLDEFHSGKDQSISNKSSEPSRLKDVVDNFLAVLTQNGKENYKSNSMFLKVEQSQGNYICCSVMPGEKRLQSADEEPTDLFWNRLLEGKQPQWKYLSCPSQRSRKRVQYSEGLTKMVEVECNEVIKKRRKMASSIVEPNSPRPIISEGDISRKKEGSSGARPQPTSDNGSVRLASNLSEVQQVNIDKSDEYARLNNPQDSLHHDLKPKMARLCEVLQLPDNVKGLVESFLEYIMNNHHVSREPDTILQAFQISLCWAAASLLKYKMDHKESLVLAKERLNFECKKEEADYVYSMLRCLKKVFLNQTESISVAFSGESSQLLSKSVSEDHLHLNAHRLISSDVPQKQDGVQIVTASQEFITSSVFQQPLGLTHQDFVVSIKDINKKCDKQMRRLLELQAKEKQDFLEKFEEDRKQLEIKQKTEAAVIRCHRHGSMRTEKLSSLDTQYAERLKILERKRVEQLLDLDAMQSTAGKELEERKLKWVEGLESWAKEELIQRELPKESGETPGIADQLVKDNSTEIQGEDSATSFREKTEAGVTNLSHGAGANLQSESISPETATTSVLVNDVLGEIGDGNITSLEEGRNSIRNSLSESVRHQSLVETAKVPNECSVISATYVPNALAEKEAGADERRLGDIDSSTDTLVAQDEARPGILNTSAINIANVCRMIDEMSVGILDIQIHGSTMQDVTTTIPDHGDGPVEPHVTNLPVMQPEAALAADAIRNPSSSGVDQEDPVILARVSSTNIQVADASILLRKDAESTTTDCSTHQLDVADSLCIAEGEVRQQDGAVPGVHEAASTEVIGVGYSLRQDNETSTEVLDNGDDGIIIRDVATTVASQDYVPREIFPKSSAALQDNSIPSVLDTGMSVDVGDEFGESNVSYSRVGQESPTSAGTTVGHQDRVVVTPLVPETNCSERVGMENSSQEYGVATQFDCGEDQNFVQNLPDEIVLTNLISMKPAAAASVQASQSWNQPLENEPRMHPASTRENLSETVTAPSTSAIGGRLLQGAAPVYQVPLPLGHDPLQNELERVCRETDRIVNLLEKEKLQLMSDCEKEIEQVAAQIRKKYEARIKEKEIEFGLSKLELDEKQNKILMNKILAEAFRSKCVDIRACNSPRVLRDAASLMQQLASTMPRQAFSRHRSSSTVASPHMPSATAGNRLVLPRAPAVHNPPAPLPGSQFRSRNANISQAPSANLQIGGQIRSPAPHLQGLTPTTSAAATTANIALGTQNQRVPNLLPNHSTVLPLRSPSLTSPRSGSVNVLNQPEASLLVPPHSSSSSASVGSQMNVDNQRTKNSVHQQQAHSGSKSEPVISPGRDQQQQPQNGTTQGSSVQQNEGFASRWKIDQHVQEIP